MTAFTPHIRADRTLALVPSALHNPGTGVDEGGDLVLSTRDITRIDELVQEGLMRWWAEAFRYRLSGEGVTAVDERVALRTLLTRFVIPAAVALVTDKAVADALKAADETTDSDSVPDIEVLLDPMAIATTFAHVFDGPHTAYRRLRSAVWLRAGDRESPSDESWWRV